MEKEERKEKRSEMRLPKWKRIRSRIVIDEFDEVEAVGRGDEVESVELESCARARQSEVE